MVGVLQAACFNLKYSICIQEALYLDINLHQFDEFLFAKKVDGIKCSANTFMLEGRRNALMSGQAY